MLTEIALKGFGRAQTLLSVGRARLGSLPYEGEGRGSRNGARPALPVPARRALRARRAVPASEPGRQAARRVLRTARRAIRTAAAPSGLPEAPSGPLAPSPPRL